MQGDQRGEVGGALGGHVEVVLDLPADQGGQQDAVAEAGDREEFRHTLQQADAYRFRVGQGGHRAPSLGGGRPADSGGLREATTGM